MLRLGGYPGELLLNIFVRPLRDKNGEIIGAIELGCNISRQRALENSLRQSRKEWTKMFNAVSDIITIQDEYMNIIQANQSCCDSLGLSLDNIIGKPCYEIFRGAKEACPECPFLEQGGINGYTREMEHKKLGKTFLVSGSPIHDNLGNLTHFIHLAKDITERKATEKALQETNTALRVLLKTRQDDQKKMEEKILFHIEQMVLPHLEHLKNYRRSQDQLLHLTSLEANLNDIISSFSYTLSSKFLDLTPSEIKVANFVRQGRTSKEIASLLEISLKTVEVHRYHIRKKLGLNRKKGNLRSFLISSFPSLHT